MARNKTMVFLPHPENPPSTCVRIMIRNSEIPSMILFSVGFFGFFSRKESEKKIFKSTIQERGNNKKTIAKKEYVKMEKRNGGAIRWNREYIFVKTNDEIAARNARKPIQAKILKILFGLIVSLAKIFINSFFSFAMFILWFTGKLSFFS